VPFAPPDDLEVEVIDLDGQQLLVFSWSANPVRAPEGLTPAEGAVLRHIGDGLSNHQIAVRRRTSVRTVANQVASLFRKLRVRSRSELVALVASPRGGRAKPR